MATEARRAHPLLWVPSLYFAMGTPMIAVSVVAAIVYKNLGLSNAEIGLYTGSMYLPWVLKPLWAPLLELYGTKRSFVITMELVMVITFSLLALSLRLPLWLPLSIAFFWMTAFASATHDIAGDGVYITSSSPREQALFIGVQGLFWNLGRILVAGLLVSLTQYLYDAFKGGEHTGAGPDPAWRAAWMCVMFIIAGILAAAALYHWAVLPTGSRATDAPKTLAHAVHTTLQAWVSFFKKPGIWMMIAAVFFYRFAEGFIEKIGPIFLIEARDKGGLGLDNLWLGNINGTIGMLGFVGGTLFGGALAARFGLKRMFVPLALALNVPHVTYYFLSHWMPTDLVLITAVVTIEKIGYGMGTCGMMLYMMQQLAPGPYKTAHYAFATGIMALCMMLTGSISGYVEEWLGYRDFFALVLALSVPPVIIAWLAPFRTPEEGEEAVQGPGAAH
jgi:PAT family beta-lactamase induction signal transducer AmpG